MRKVHVECLPDETLVKKLGITKKSVIHHSGKSRVFHKLRDVSNEVAMVDEDPGTAKTQYEKELILEGDSHGIKKYADHKGNTVLELKIKLEDWIINTCKASNIDITKNGLPEKPNQLHDTVNNRIQAFEKLIDRLLEAKSERILKLQEWLK